MKSQVLKNRDSWECLQSTLWSTQLPATTLSEFISRSAPLLVIVLSDGWYTMIDHMGGQKYECSTLNEAKSIGDAIVDAMELDQARNLTVSAGLDPDQWTFCCQDRFVWFEKRSEPTAKLERYGETHWVVEFGGKRIGIAGSAMAGATLISQFK